ncbi:hypothetical protein FAI40_03370 [Acetobacteraceae bacterium]|nr:hypothetical protein FAI40_03370 [Acetobacteraceae bacterium]
MKRGNFCYKIKTLRLNRKVQHMKVINLIGGPGSGKTTTASHIFALLKEKQIGRVELVGEFAKDVVYDEAFSLFKDQLFILAQQNHRLERLRDKVDYAIVDSPLPLILAHADGIAFNMKRIVTEVFNSYDNINFVLEREASLPYEEYGRYETLEQAKELDKKMVEIFKPFPTIKSNAFKWKEIAEFIMEDYKKDLASA